MKPFLPSSKSLLIAAALTALHAGAASAGEVYGTVGFVGYGVGYAHPISDSLGVRADYATTGSRTERRTEEGITYDAKAKFSRANLLVDWFVMSGSFRASAGLTSADSKLVLDANGAGGTINVGGTNYTTTAADGLTATIKYPSTMPYLGIGWGHGGVNTKGWRFAADIGAAIGKPKVSVVTRGQLANPSAQADVDRETKELRDGVGAAKVLPQVMFSVGYSF